MSSAADGAVRPRAPAATRSERRMLALLGLPTFGLALSITIVSTYLPVLIEDFTSSGTVIGLILGGEGLFALFLPILIGGWSDGTDTRLGSRTPFILAAAPLAALALVLMPFAASLAVLAGLVLLFFVAYFTYYPPYRALFPDLVPAHLHGRAQSSQALWRGVGLGAALGGGGVLLGFWRPLPFLLAAVALAAVTAVLVLKVREEQPCLGCCLPHGVGETTARVWSLVRERAGIRAFVAANALWELSLAALKTFIVLFFVAGLGRTVEFASALIGVVAAATLVAALVSGSLADRFGTTRVMHVALWIYGIGLLLPFFSQSVAFVLPAVPLIAFGGAVIMTLPYALLMGMMPPESHGALSGLYSFSRGLGVVLGPLLAGAAIDLLRPWLDSTDGYAAMWLVAAAAVLLSIPLVRSIDVRERPPSAPAVPEAGPIAATVRPEAARGARRRAPAPGR